MMTPAVGAGKRVRCAGAGQASRRSSLLTRATAPSEHRSTVDVTKSLGFAMTLTCRTERFGGYYGIFTTSLRRAGSIHEWSSSAGLAQRNREKVLRTEEEAGQFLPSNLKSHDNPVSFVSELRIVSGTTRVPQEVNPHCVIDDFGLLPTFENCDSSILS